MTTEHTQGSSERTPDINGTPPLRPESVTTAEHIPTQREGATDGNVMLYERTHPMDVTRPNAQMEWRYMKSSDRARACDAAILGYALLDVVGPPTRFRLLKLNDRPLENAAVQMLLRSFKEDCLRFQFDNMFPVLATKKMIQVDHLSKDKHAGGNLPLLKFTQEFAASTPEPLFGLGGQHRLAALRLYMEFRRKELARIQDAIKKLDSLRDRDEGEDKRLEQLQEEEHTLEKEVARGGKWGIIVYDADKLSDGLMYHLSENKTTVIYNKTAGEKFMEAGTILLQRQEECDKMDDRQKAKRHLDACIREINSTRAHVSSVFQMEASRTVILHFVRNRDHFRSMEAIDWNWMNEHFCNVVGGLTKELWSQNVMWFESLFRPITGPLPSFASTKKIINIRKQNGTHSPDQAIEWEQLCEAMTAPSYIGDTQTQMITTELLDALDSSFMLAFNSEGKLMLAGGTSPDAAHSWDQYVCNVDADINEYISSKKHWRSTEEKQVATQIRSRLLVSLYWMRQEGEASMPLPTRSVFIWIVKMLEGISEILKEVSRWFDLLVDYNLAVARTNSPHDYTAAMFNIFQTASIFSRDALPQVNGPPLTLSTKVAFFLWGHRLKLLTLCEMSILGINQIVCRPASIALLNKIYPNWSVALKKVTAEVKQKRVDSKKATSKKTATRQVTKNALSRQPQDDDADADGEEEEESTSKQAANDAEIAPFRDLLLNHLGVSHPTEVAVRVVTKMKEIGKSARYGSDILQNGDILGLAFHTGWPWNKDPKSSTRSASTVAQCALLERANMNFYREEILAVPEIHWLRNKLKGVIQPFYVPIPPADKCMPLKTEFGWPDQYDPEPNGDMSVFQTEDECHKRLVCRRKMHIQISQIRKALESIQKLDVAHLSTSVVTKERVLAHEVGQSLDSLQKALEFNSARQRFREFISETSLYKGEGCEEVGYARMSRGVDPNSAPFEADAQRSSMTPDMDDRPPSTSRRQPSEETNLNNAAPTLSLKRTAHAEESDPNPSNQKRRKVATEDPAHESEDMEISS